MEHTTTEVMNDDQRTKIIRREVQLASKEIRAKYPFLQHQNAIGFFIFSFSIAMIVLSAVLYLQGTIGMIAVVLSVAFWTSLLHELEHDLIHYMYFKKNKFLHNLMMLGVWVFRPMTINPWFRRDLHFHHHQLERCHQYCFWFHHHVYTRYNLQIAVMRFSGVQFGVVILRQ